MTARAIKPAEDVEPPTPEDDFRVDTCPCGKTYRCLRRADPDVKRPWIEHHEQHGYQWGRP